MECLIWVSYCSTGESPQGSSALSSESRTVRSGSRGSGVLGMDWSCSSTLGLTSGLLYRFRDLLLRLSGLERCSIRWKGGPACRLEGKMPFSMTSLIQESSLLPSLDRGRVGLPWTEASPSGKASCCMRGVLSSAGCLFLPHMLPFAAGHRIVGVLNFGRFFFYCIWRIFFTSLLVGCRNGILQTMHIE